MRVNPRQIHATNTGFTLIELLVVIVIIGVVLSIATLSIGVLGRDNQIEEQAKRLDAVISQVHEESELQGRDIGVFVERDGYLFMRYDYTMQSWQEMSDDSLTAHRELPAGLQMRLWLEGREVILKSHQENEQLLASSSSSDSSESSSSSLSVTNMKDATKNPRVPQIFLLSSGDLSPFELRIEREGNNFSWHLVGKADSTITTEISDAKK